MAGTTRFTITGDRAVARKIRAYGARAQDMESAWPKVGSYFSRLMRQQFATQGARLGKPWKPLKPAYRVWKIRHGYSRNILVQTGKLKESFTKRPMDIEEYHGDHAVFGSSLDTAVWHQFGTRRHGKRINPPRPILYVTKEVRADVRQILADHIAGRETL